MPDLTEQLSSILSDPAGMEKIRAMAQSLLGGEAEAATATPAPTAEDQTTAAQKTELPDIASISRMAQMLSQRGDDDRVRLLMALRPHLSAEKQARVDKAVKMLKLLDLAPLLSKMGIFEF